MCNQVTITFFVFIAVSVVLLQIYASAKMDFANSRKHDDFLSRWSQVQEDRVEKLKIACEKFGNPQGFTSRFASRTAVIPELDFSYCQIAKTSSTSITNQILKALSKKGKPEVEKQMADCERKGKSYCNFHTLLRNRLK